MWEPEHITERFSVQSGIFAILRNPTNELSESIFYKIVVSASKKSKILQSLAGLGINEASLFPGL